MYSAFLADVNVSKNPNTFNFWAAKYERNKKTGKQIHHNLFEYMSFFAIEDQYIYLLGDMDHS